MQKKTYSKAEMSVTLFDCEEVLTASVNIPVTTVTWEEEPTTIDGDEMEIL